MWSISINGRMDVEPTRHEAETVPEAVELIRDEMEERILREDLVVVEIAVEGEDAVHPDERSVKAMAKPEELS